VNTSWPGNITATIEIGSQRGPAYSEEYHSFSDHINSFLTLGWRILTTYVEDKGPESSREECVCLLGWPETSEPRYPEGYKQ
jgi:hypothetical protein